jgi:hypothetical protein
VRRYFVLSTLIAALCGSGLAATPQFETSHRPLLKLVAPVNGATLRGGDFATLSWTVASPFEAEEWEAFLSLDGGRYYSARLTPHLAIGTRTFAFVAPNIDTDDARLLIRIGDERRETILEFPQRFSIRATAAPIVQPLGSRFGGPESARPGEDPVIQWANGFAVETSSRHRTAFESARRERDDAQCQATLVSHEAASLSPAHQVAPEVCVSTGSRSASAPIARDVLRLTRRMNV